MRATSSNVTEKTIAQGSATDLKLIVSRDGKCQ